MQILLVVIAIVVIVIVVDIISIIPVVIFYCLVPHFYFYLAALLFAKAAMVWGQESGGVHFDRFRIFCSD
jgi:hypothetical protein